MTSEPSNLFCIDCGEATPFTGGERPKACAHCGSTFPSEETAGTHIRAIPASGKETAAHEPDLDPDKFWEIPAAFKSREEADAHNSRIFRRKIGTAIFVLVLGIAASVYLYKNAPPYRMSDQAEAATAPGSPQAQEHTKAIETAVEVIESAEWSELKKFVSPTSPTVARMAKFYKNRAFQQGEVLRIKSVTGDPDTKIYDVDLILKNGPTRNVGVDLSGSSPQILWESFSKYSEWTWQQFGNEKSNTAQEVFVRVKQVPASSTAIDDIGINAENAVGLALWHDDPSRPLYSVVDKTSAVGQAIIEATNSDSATELVVSLVPAPEPAPSFLVVVRKLVQSSW
ncbi:hypothetical protein OAF27_00315 [Verrucomicrobiales bacterium]|nr:hypothetical protein [Verrucomicrobiales bacterium]